MKIYRGKDYADAGRIAGNILGAQIVSKPDSVLGLATGSTPIGAYERLIEMYKEGDVDFGELKTVNLDEYRGLNGDHDQSYRYFMNTHLFNSVNIDKNKTFVPNGMEPDQDKACAEYDKIVEEEVVDGGIDLVDGEVAAGCDFRCVACPNSVDHSLVLLHILRARGVLDEHLAGGLVLSVADELDIDPELVEEVLEEEHLGADADEHRCAALLRSHIDLVRHRCQVVAGGGRRLDVGDDRLRAFAEVLEALSEFLDLGNTAGDPVSLEENIFYARVLSSLVEGLDSLPETYRLGGCAALHKGHNVIGTGSLLCQNDLGHIHDHHSGLRKDRSGAG